MASISKAQIIAQLKQIASLDEPNQNILEAGNVRNLQLFGKKVDIDIVTSHPALASRKKLELEIMQVIHREIDKKLQVNVRTTVLKSEKKEAQNPMNAKTIPGIKNILAISSGKGGVGKSTVTTNLAISLQKMGFSVGLLDADIYGPSIPTMFDAEHQRPTAVEKDGKKLMVPVEAYGVKILSIGFFANTDQAVAWRGPMATKALTQMIHDADWGELDFLLIDLPPGTGDIHLSIVQSIPVTGAVVVSTPQKIALIDARKGVALYQLESIRVPVLGLIENMAYFTPEELPENQYYIFGKEGTKNLCQESGIPFLGEVPIVQSLRESADSGYPLSLKEEHPVTNQFQKITQNLISQTLKRNETLPPSEVTRITNMSGCSAVK